MSERNLPLVSVAIPAYNHASFIEACLESIYQQTYPELELILCDDGSTDGTFELAEKFLAGKSERFRRVVLLKQENQGVSASSNAAVFAAQGEWVHLLGSDDLLHPQKVEKIQVAIEALNCPELALVHADICMIDDLGHQIDGGRLHKSRPPAGIDREAWRWLFFNNQYIFNPTVTLRRDAMLSIGGFDSNLALEDLDCWLRLSVKYPIARVAESLASYRKHPGNSSRKRLKMLSAMLRTFGNFLAHNPGLFDDETIRRHYRSNLKQVWRRFRAHRPAWLPKVAGAAFQSLHKTPGADDYYYFADLVGEIVATSTAFQ